MYVRIYLRGVPKSWQFRVCIPTHTVDQGSGRRHRMCSCPAISRHWCMSWPYGWWRIKLVGVVTADADMASAPPIRKKGKKKEKQTRRIGKELGSKRHWRKKRLLRAQGPKCVMPICLMAPQSSCRGYVERSPPNFQGQDDDVKVWGAA